MAEQKQQKKEFDLALCIDAKEQYKLVLCGPIIYEYTPRHFGFTSSQKYIKGDVNKVNEAANFVQEIDTERYINAFLHGAKDVTDTDPFKDIVKLQLFIFKDESVWHKYISAQKQLKSDVVVIVNNLNKPMLVLHDARTSMLDQTITFNSLNTYQTKDIAILDRYAAKTKTFGISPAWRIKIKQNRDTFKNGLCYTFHNDECRDKLLRQSYDVALVTDTQNQIQLLLSGVTYIYKDCAISFKTSFPYKNGFYQKLKQFGEQVRAFKPKEYRLESNRFDTDFEQNKCLLFNIAQIEQWIDFIEAQTNVEYDAAVVTNTNDYQVIFINKLQINCMEKTVLFAESETFTPKHHGLINKFGKLVKMKPFGEYNIPQLVVDAPNKGKLKTIYFYTWDMNKPQTAAPEQPIGPVTVTDANGHSDKQTNKTIKKKKKRDQSPNGSKKKKTGAKGKNKGKSKKEKGNLSVKRDSVIRPSAARKLKKAKSVQSNTLSTGNAKKMSKTRSYDTKSRSRGQSTAKPAKRKGGLKVKTNKIKKAKSYIAPDSRTTGRNGSAKKGKKKKKGNGKISDTNEIWDLFITIHGKKPKSVYQIESFAKSNKKAKTLSHKEARELFRDRSK
eukprot:204437_1